MSTYKINPNKKTVPTINIAKKYPHVIMKTFAGFKNITHV